MNNMWNKIVTTATQVAGKTGLVLQKKSPEILLGLGIAGSFISMYLTARGALKADEDIHARKIKIKEIHDCKAVADDGGENEKGELVVYDDDLYKQDLRVQYLKMGLEVARDFAPAAALMGLSMTSILASRNILNKRYLGAVAAYNAVSEAFQTYRKRVKDEAGEAMDRHYRYGATTTLVTNEEVDENGKKKKTKEPVENFDTKLVNPSDTARFFDESNPNWDPNPNFNLMFLKGMQNRLNDILHTRGHLFLNEVYDALGFAHTTEGAVLGWIMGAGDDYVDFGLYDDTRENVRRFINGQDNIVLLDFNHDGVIFDKI